MATKSVGRRETRKDELAEPQFLGGGSRVEDVVGLTAAADEDHQVTGVGVGLQGLGHPPVVAVVVAEACDQAWIVEVHGPDTSCLYQVDREVTGDCRTPTIPYEDHLPTLAVGDTNKVGRRQEGGRIHIGDETGEFTKVPVEKRSHEATEPPVIRRVSPEQPYQRPPCSNLDPRPDDRHHTVSDRFVP